MSDANDEMTDDELATRTKQLLGVAVGGAPSAPTVADIESRMSAQMAETEGRAAARSAVVADDSRWSSEARAVAELADYVTPAPDGGSRRGARWPRLALAAAAIVAVVAIGVALVGRGGDETTLDQAESPTTEAAPGAGPAVAMLPTTPPAGQVLTWFGSVDTDEGEMLMLRYGGLSGLEPLSVTTALVGPGYSIPETGESGSIEQWGDREVTVTDGGRRVQFVDPAGVYVQVTGHPDHVAAYVPTLALVDAEQRITFVDQMSVDIAAMPEIAAYEIEAGGPEGFDVDGVNSVRMSIHANPESRALGAVPEGGTGTTSGVVAGTCLTVDGATTCRPGDPMGDGVPRKVSTAYDVLIDGEWWQFGWVTDELTSYSLEPDVGGEAEAFWYFDDSGDADSLTWFAGRLPAGAQEVSAELGGNGGFVQRRPLI